VYPLDRIKKKILKKEHYIGGQDLQSIGVNRVEMLVLLLPHFRRKEFLPWDGQIGPVILGGLH
jgi:hypothetical protein